MNFWKASTISLVIILMLLGLKIEYNKEAYQVYDFGGDFQITKGNLDRLINVIESDYFRVCDLDNELCINGYRNSTLVEDGEWQKDT